MNRVICICLGMIVLFLTIDIIDDLNHGSHILHVAYEGVAATIAVAIVVSIIISAYREIAEQRSLLTSSLQQFEEERARWQAQNHIHITGLSEAIERQFSAWKLSESEADVALLILKGLSHKEIAELRGTSEKTVRQQAAAIYAKAGLSGKAQLSAFFLEDLMLPSKSQA